MKFEDLKMAIVIIITMTNRMNIIIGSRPQKDVSSNGKDICIGVVVLVIASIPALEVVVIMVITTVLKRIMVLL